MPNQIVLPSKLKKILQMLAAGVFTATPLSFAQTPSSQAPTTFTEHGKLLRAPEAIGVLGADLFGDKLNFYNGGLEFVQADVSLPGNSGLPVGIARRLTTGEKNLSQGAFMEWELEIPRIHGTFSKLYGWQKALAGGGTTVERCTNFGAPPDAVVQLDTYRSFEYWHGNSLYVPGVGDQEILKRDAGNTQIPSDGQATPLVTKNNWAIQCLSSLASTDGATPANQRGQGFLAIAPDGTRYRFDWLVTREALTLSKPAAAEQLSETFAAAKSPHKFPAWSKPAPAGVAKAGSAEDLAEVAKFTAGGTPHASLPREEVWILPTLITDRFGNTVTYTYDPSNKGRLLSITASDGRAITLTHQPGTNFISSATDGTRTWSYTYGQVDSGRTMLTTVTLPDNSTWQLGGLDGGRDRDGNYGLEGLVQMQIEYRPTADDGQPWCDLPPAGLDARTATGSMVHPSGAIGTFTMTPVSKGRNGVPLGCYGNGTQYGAPMYPAYIDSYSMTEKKISGLGLPELVWRNNYDGTYVPGWSDCAQCIQPAIVLATDPAGHVTRYTFGSTYAVDEGLLKQVDIGWDGSGAIRTTATRYNRSFTQPIGTSDQNRGDNWISEHRLPEDQRIITQQGTTFKWEVASGGFDGLARPTKVTRSSSLGYSRAETTVYSDQLSKWILGQIKSVTETGSNIVMVSNTYDTTYGNLLTNGKYGLVEKTFTYNPDGTLATAKDGKLQSTSYTNYKRGIPQTISYPNSTSESVVVNDIGLITSHTNAAQYTTGYGYDAMGRLNRITPPEGAQTTLVFEQVLSPEVGLEAGHWRHTVTKGNSVTVTYMDNMWRPVYKLTYDSANYDATKAAVVTHFDHAGMPTRISYPQRDISSINAPGNSTFNDYDALQRVIHIASNAESGVANTYTTYLGGFQKQTVNPRGHATTTSYQAFDQPVESAPTAIAAPEGVSVAIARNILGNTTSITRSGGGKSAMRTYVYDANQRLCKIIEPETGGTLQDYDAASNVVWRATLATATTVSCDRTAATAASKISFGYDTLNRLTTTTYGDGSPGITRTYTPDGLPWTVSTNGANPTTWTMAYNARRLLTEEKLTYGGSSYALKRDYNSNGHLTKLTYPDTTDVQFNPNGLGQPTSAGIFATGVTYHPNGGVSGFTYGNGIVRTVTQNQRGLPLQAKDAGVLQDTYGYDLNGNVTSIADGTANNTSRTMGYDGLDRLTSTSAPGLWGAATYGYDALDNLTSSTVSTRTSTHNYNAATNRLTSISSSAPAYSLAYDYDAQGNIRQRGGQIFTFDQGNRLKSATGKATYVYDGFGRRVQILGNDGSQLLQVYSTVDGQLLLAAQRGGAKPQKDTKYVYLNRHVVAEVEVAK